MEALLRMCRKMTPLDIWQRTMPIPSSTRKDSGRTAYNARRDRFRRRSGLIAWTQRPGSTAIKEATREAIGEWGRKNNSTRDFEGFSKDQLEAILRRAKASKNPKAKAGRAKSGIKKKAEHEGDEGGENEKEVEEEGEDEAEADGEEEDAEEDEDVVDVEEGLYDDDEN